MIHDWKKDYYTRFFAWLVFWYNLSIRILTLFKAIYLFGLVLIGNNFLGLNILIKDYVEGEGKKLTQLSYIEDNVHRRGYCTHVILLNYLRCFLIRLTLYLSFIRWILSMFLISFLFALSMIFTGCLIQILLFFCLKLRS